MKMLFETLFSYADGSIRNFIALSVVFVHKSGGGSGVALNSFEMIFDRAKQSK